MGFGSYDEGEQEQDVNEDEESGEAVTKQDCDYKGKDGIEDEDTNDMMRHL